MSPPKKIPSIPVMTPENIKSGKKVIYKEFPGVEHSSWNNAYNDPEFMKWLFKQKK